MSFQSFSSEQRKGRPQGLMVLQEKESVLGLQFHAIRYANVLSADKTLFNPLLLQSPCFKTHSLSLSHLLSYGLFICGTFPSFFFFAVSLAHCQSFNSASLLLSNSSPLFHSWSFMLTYTYPFMLLFSSVQGYWFFCGGKKWWNLLSLSLSQYPFFAGPCVLWSSWRFLRTAATGPALSQPRHALIWPRSWRSTLRCPSIMQASTCRCSASPCSPQRCTPAELHPKPSNVSRISHGLWTLCIIHSLQHRNVCKWCALWIVRLRFEILYCRTSRLAVSKFGIVLFN